MNEQMHAAQTTLLKLLQAEQHTAGMYVRVHGNHLIAGRSEPQENDDRVRFTKLAANRYGVSVKRYTGRWEKTPFCGTLEETVNVVCSVMQHLVAAS